MCALDAILYLWLCLSWLTEHELLAYCITAVDTATQNSNRMSAEIMPSGSYLVILNVWFEAWSCLCCWDFLLQEPATRMCCRNNATDQHNCCHWLAMACWMWLAADAVVSLKCYFWTGDTSTRSQGDLIQALFCVNAMLVITSSCQSLSRKPQLLQWGKNWRGNLRHWWERWKQRQTKSAKSGGTGCRWVALDCVRASAELLSWGDFYVVS